MLTSIGSMKKALAAKIYISLDANVGGYRCSQVRIASTLPGIDRCTQFFASLEVRHLLSGHADFFTIFGGASITRWSIVQAECPKTSNLDPLPTA